MLPPLLLYYSDIMIILEGKVRASILSLAHLRIQAGKKTMSDTDCPRLGYLVTDTSPASCSNYDRTLPAVCVCLIHGLLI